MEAKFEFIEQHLLKGSYLNGDSPTIADISISCSLYVPTFVGFKFCPESKLVSEGKMKKKFIKNTQKLLLSEKRWRPLRTTKSCQLKSLN